MKAKSIETQNRNEAKRRIDTPKYQTASALAEMQLKENTIVKANLELAAMVKQLEAQIQDLTTRLKSVEVERDNALDQRNRAVYQSKYWFSAFLDKRNAHEKLSYLYRMNVSPEQHHKSRREAELTRPDLF